MSPDELSNDPAASPETPEARAWTPPEQPVAGGYPPQFHPNPPAPYPRRSPTPAFPPPPGPSNGLGSASLVFGILAVLFSWFPGVGFIVGICAVVTGVAARKRIKRGEADNNGVTVAGITLGIVGGIVGGLILMSFLYLIISYQVCIDHAHGRSEYARC
jgi:Domain of unknown function (DUF4190)